jgi:Nucleotidyl transferase AbiEii toxin, Type IV TA system
MADDPTPLPVPLVSALNELLEALPAHGANYALIGGIAAGLRSRFRYTEDIDLLLSVPQLRLPGLLDDLAARGFSCDVPNTLREFSQHNMAVIWFQGVRIDWLKPMLPIYQHVLDRAVSETWRGRTVRIATAEGLILMKLLASRPQDLVDVDALLAANRGHLDLAWVEAEWQTLFPTDDPRWQRFRQSVAEYYDRPDPASGPTPPAR